jgi:hypothetical protein
MIKKIIYTIGFLMFLSGPLHPLFGQAADNSLSEKERCEFSPNPDCRFDANEGLDWGDSFGATDPNKVGKDLYKIIYKKTQVDTTDKAMQATAEQYGMQVEKMRLIVGGNITPILERNPLMRVEDASQIYNQMASAYQDKKNSIDLEANIKAKVEPNEIFADGDLGNSGFDLINDLNNIEIILFKKADLVDIGGQYSPGSSGSDNGTPVPTQASAGNKAPNSGGGNPSGSKSQSGSGSTNGAGSSSSSAPKSPFDSATTENKEQVLNGFNPNQCFSDNKAKKALDDFQKDLQNNDKLKSNYEPGQGGSNGSSGNSGNGNGGNSTKGGSNNGNNNTSPNNQNSNNKNQEIPAAKPDNWDQNPLCNDIFCMTLEFVSKPVTPEFDKTDNCIQCHVQYINDSLQKTISHSLIPGKATGNMGESGLCKNASGTALGSVGMNVSLSVVPIMTPVKNEMADLSLDMGISRSGKEMVTKTGLEWDLLKCKQDPRSCLDKKVKQAKDPNDKTPAPSDLERELLVAVNTASDNASTVTVWNNGASAAQLNTNITGSGNVLAAVADEAMGQAQTYQALDLQMKQMNDFFSAFLKLYQSIIEVEGASNNSTKACVKLNQKEACS